MDEIIDKFLNSVNNNGINILNYIYIFIIM